MEQSLCMNNADDTPGDATDAARRFWYAVYVRSRHEFKVTEHLGSSGVEVFLPTIERQRRWKDRKKVVTFPLFPGYIFVRLPQSKPCMLPVLKTPGVVRFISLRPGSPEPVPDVQIESVRKMAEHGAGVEPYPGLQAGRRVRIVAGPLAGVEGVLQTRRGQHLLVISIDLLRQGAAVQIDALDVEPL